MRDGVMASWRRLSAGGGIMPIAATRAAQNLCPLLAEEERPRDAGEDDGCMIATPSKSAATLDLPVLLQMRLP
jgi:hypothetical protein